MPFPALETTVRPDWRDLTQEMKIHRLRLWRAIEIVIALAALAVLIVSLLFPSWAWSRALALGLFPIVFWMLTVWTVLRAQLSIKRAFSRALAIYFVLLVAAIIAFLTTPGAFVDRERVWAPAGSFAFSVLIPLLTLPILVWIGRAGSTASTPSSSS